VHTPIKIEATQGQVTLCSENFPGTNSLRPLTLALGSVRRRSILDSTSFDDQVQANRTRRKMDKLLALMLLATCVTAGPTVGPAQDLNCLDQDNELFSCIFVKTVSVLDRAARSSDIEIVDGITFVRDTPSKALTLSFSHFNHSSS